MGTVLSQSMLTAANVVWAARGDHIAPGQTRGSIDDMLLGRCKGSPDFRRFLSSVVDLLRTIYGLAPVAELDGDELG